ncbi:hypothetical protein OSB04_un000231 [Centaurea solstitialis]|uniref:F-box domain-containing protein n=1 Tax=Centaurea solstitialis TaxID=347529 RepID=A0AA38VVQ2_9ASTR|nr:hypothetical protein OSB04_un000231 [Centaurea solstitialis]
MDRSMEELPTELTIDVLSRLPLKTIIRCKLVCKKWRNLVSDSSFVNLHLSRSPTGLLIHQIVKGTPGIFKWVDIEDKVDDHRLNYDPLMSFDINMVPFLRNYLINKMGSVNGLICIRLAYLKNENTYICNPVTREIMTISIPQYYKQDFVVIACGFGVSSVTGEYKLVVQTLKRNVPLNGNKLPWGRELVAEVYTLGTGQWRRLGRVPYWLDDCNFGVVLNDHCHWIISNRNAHEKICTFDLNKETFQLFPSPPREESDNDFRSLAVVKGCLCISDGGGRFPITIWVMKEYGIKKSWHKEVVITEEAVNRCRELPYSYDVYMIGDLKDGTIFFMDEDLFAFYPRSGTIEKIEALKRSQSGVPYRPSFLKLQNFESERVHRTSSPMMTKIVGTFLENWHLWFLFFQWSYGVGGQKVLVVAETFGRNRCVTRNSLHYMLVQWKRWHLYKQSDHGWFPNHLGCGTLVEAQGCGRILIFLGLKSRPKALGAV